MQPYQSTLMNNIDHVVKKQRSARKQWPLNGFYLDIHLKSHKQTKKMSKLTRPIIDAYHTANRTQGITSQYQNAKQLL